MLTFFLKNNFFSDYQSRSHFKGGKKKIKEKIPGLYIIETLSSLMCLPGAGDWGEDIVASDSGHLVGKAILGLYRGSWVGEEWAEGAVWVRGSSEVVKGAGCILLQV